MTALSQDFRKLRDTIHDTVAADALMAKNLRAFPVLPHSWPCDGKVRIYGYRSQAMPTGVVKHRVWSPQLMVVYDLMSEKQDVEILDSERSLGESSTMGSSSQGDWKGRLRDAEAALLELCSGAAADSLRPQLKGYLDWLAAEPVFSDVVQHHVPEFVAWLKS